VADSAVTDAVAVNGPVPNRRQLTFAALAVLVAAADTYVVVVVLPSMMSGVGLGVQSLSHATPIVSGFLLGYVVVLPLLGRLSDLLGPGPVFAGCLTVFALGSLVTATAHTLPVLVAGRTLQGVGGGGVVPVALSLVAARWPPERRGVPLGVIGAVQELGSVVGPLYGSAVVELGNWRTIFWINLPLVAVIGPAFAWAARRGRGTVPPSGRPGRDPLGALLAAVGLAAFGLGLDAPAGLADRVTLGRAFTPLVAGASWVALSDPLAVAGSALVLAALALGLRRHPARRPVVDLRALGAALRRADLPGALLLGVVLACVVTIFSTADPERQLVASSTPVAAVVGVVALVGLVVRQRLATTPLLEPRLLASRRAVGSLLVNLAVGAGLIAALVDVPLFARLTVNGESQVGAALVLVRFLAAVPVGALLGGLLCRRPGRGSRVAATGAALAAVTFVAMTSWGERALTTPWHLAGTSLGLGASDVELVVCGLGFGLVIAPVNAAVLASVPDRLHGLAASLAVVARTVGMLAGLSVLTAIGIRRFDQAQKRIGSPFTICPGHASSCPAYSRASDAALLRELHTIFGGAAGCTAAAAVLALVLLSAGGPGTTTRSSRRPSIG
jgi:MFS family permease